MEVSSTSMKVASMTAIATSHGLETAGAELACSVMVLSSEASGKGEIPQMLQRGSRVYFCCQNLIS
jgi:hypothetical protein